jgi:hypothetical protein
LLLCRMACAVFGFQPLNHLARREWQKSAEYLCDAWAVNRTGSRLALARCLTEVAGWRWRRSDCAASLAATGRRAGGLADRIERLVTDAPLEQLRREDRVRHRLVLGAGLAFAAGIWLAPRVSLSVAGQSIEKPASANQAASVVQVDSVLAVPNATSNSQVPPLPVLEEQLAALEVELAALESELAALEPMLRQARIPASARQLGSQMRLELQRLQSRRERLMRLLSRPVVVRPAIQRLSENRL